MASEALLRPQTAGSAILGTGSTSGVDGSTIFMKVSSARFALSMGVLDTTGDGDQFTQVDHNNEYRGQITLSGFVLAIDDIGIQTLQDAVTATTFVNPVSVHFKAANETFYRFKMTIRDIIVDWNRQAPVVGIAVVGMLTSNITANEAFSETTT